MQRLLILAVLIPFAAAANAETLDDPKPIPLTRPEIKRALDELKRRQPRLPMPALSSEEIARSGRPPVNNGRMRSLYLPEELTISRRSRSSRTESDSKFDYAFSTELFWIVSRVNNCHYCLGHQENKLSSAGLTDDQIAVLDTDWSSVEPSKRAAYEFAKKLTAAPHDIGQEDVDRLAAHFDPAGIVELTFLVSRYNSTNRWTDALGIPQEDHRTLLTPTGEAWTNRATQLAPAATSVGRASPPKSLARPAWESPDEVSQKLADARQRRPRLPLADEARTRSLLKSSELDAVPQWVRLLATAPNVALPYAENYLAAQRFGRLSPTLKAQLAWIAARHDRAWYALDLAREKLLGLGFDDDRINELGSADATTSPGEAAAFRLARKLTVQPQWIVDDDIARLREHYSDHETAEIVFHLTQAAFFNRLTETAGLTAGR